MTLHAKPSVVIGYTAPIPIKKTHELSKIPTRGSNSAAGYDLYSTEEYILKPLERKLFKTGISMAIPVGLYGRIAPRSGLAYKDGIDTMAGVIDDDYRGDIGVILINLGSVDKKISIGDKIAQIIFENYTPAEFSEVADLPDTNRGEGGFGSTDAKLSNSPEVISIRKGDALYLPTMEQSVSSVNKHVADVKRYEDAHKGKSLAEIYKKEADIQIKQRYIDEVKDRQQQK